MVNVFKSLALRVPAIRRLHEERGRYAADVADLRGKLASVQAVREQVQHDHEQLQLQFTDLQEKFRDQVSRISSNRLHVIGYARSGTTILMDILNSSSNIFLFSELNLHALRRFPDVFSAYGGNNFVEHFVERKKAELPLLYKSALPPQVIVSAGMPVPGPDEYLNAVGRKYAYVGDKIATAHRQLAGVTDLDLLKEFLDAEETIGAALIFTLRRPSENLLSVSKMFPDVDIREWGRSLSQTMVVILEAFLKGNRSYLVFHEDIGPLLIAELSSLLGVDLRISPNLVGADHQASRGQRIPLEDTWVAVLDSAYVELYELYRCDVGVIKRSKTDGLTKRVAVEVERLKTVSKQL